MPFASYRSGPGTSLSHERSAHLALPVAVLALSFSAIFVRWSVSPPQELAALRLILSAAILLPWAYRREAARAFSRRTLALTAMSGLALGAHYIVWFDSLGHTSVASSTLLVTLHPLIVVPLSYLFWGRKTSGRGIAGILLALVGGALITGGDLALDAAHIRGDVEAFAAAIAMGVYLLIGSAVRKSVGLAPYTVCVYAVGGVVALAFAAFDGVAWPDGSGEWLVVGGLVLIPTLIGHTVFNWSLGHISPTTVSVSILGEPVGAVLLAGFIFGETPSVWQILGGITLLGGVYTFARHANTQES